MGRFRERRRVSRLVIAILAADKRPDLRVTLVESDQRKAAFLRSVSRETGLTVQVYAGRAEALAPQSCDTLSARALAPLPQLLGLAERHLAPSGLCLFPKGATYQSEIDRALENWRFTYQKVESVTQPDAVVLAIRDIQRVEQQR